MLFGEDQTKGVCVWLYKHFEPQALWLNGGKAATRCKHHIAALQEPTTNPLKILHKCTEMCALEGLNYTKFPTVGQAKKKISK